MPPKAIKNMVIKKGHLMGSGTTAAHTKGEHCVRGVVVNNTVTSYVVRHVLTKLFLVTYHFYCELFIYNIETGIGRSTIDSF
jgi:hypothetical protein